MSCKILLLEDETMYQEYISLILDKLGYNQFKIASNYKEGRALLDSFQPNLAILDVNLSEEKTGIDFAVDTQLASKIPFIFLTSMYDLDHYEKAKQTRPSQYLDKRFSELDLKQAIELSLADFKPQSDLPSSIVTKPTTNDGLFIKKGTLHQKVLFSNIIGIESDGKYILIHTNQRRYITTYTMNQIMEVLPKNKFLRIHRKWIINKSKITAINTSTYEVSLGESNIYPIGRSYRKQVIAVLPSI